MLMPGLDGSALADDQESRGVKLSDAMKASVSGNQQDLSGNSHESSQTPNSSAHLGPGFWAGFTEVNYEKGEYFLQMPMDISYAVPVKSVFRDLTHFTVTPVAFETDDFFIGAYVGGATVEFQPGSLPDQAVDSAWMLDAGLTIRCYLNPSYTAFSPYLAVNVGCVLLNWDYRNSIMAGGDTIASDSLEGAEATVGFGISTCRARHLRCFAEAGIGGTAFSAVTTQGFDNDVFHNFGFVYVKAGLCLKF